MAVEQRSWNITPGDTFSPVFEGSIPFKVCAGTIQAANGAVVLGFLGSDQEIIELNSLAAWDVDGQDLSKLTAKQKTSGGSAQVRFSGTVHSG